MTGLNVGFIGLGRIGFPMALHLLEQKFPVSGFDLSAERRDALAQSGGRAYGSARELAGGLPNPGRVFILLVPAGDPVDAAIQELLPALEPGDVVMDCGNSHFQASRRRYAFLKNQRIEFLDVGTSGGISGARNGACLTVGGDRDVFDRVRPVLEAVARRDACLYVGPSGWGHLVKTVHNGIEYGFLQAIAEGFHVLKEKADEEKVDVNLIDLAGVWNRGSIIESRLIGDTEKALRLLESRDVPGRVRGGETGTWAQKIGDDVGVETPALDAALAFRRQSSDEPSETGRIIAAIRAVFGQHDVNG